jgi:hypothetical protein
MRTIVRDKEDVYISKRGASTPYLDDNGYPTGESVITYGEIKKYSLRVSLLKSYADIQVYGADAKELRKIVESTDILKASDIGYLDLVWVGKVPEYYGETIPVNTPPSALDNNFIVTEKPEITPRQIVVMIKSVVANG